MLGSKKVVQWSHSPGVQALFTVKELLEAGKETWGNPVQQAGGVPPSKSAENPDWPHHEGKGGGGSGLRKTGKLEMEGSSGIW